MMIAAIYPLSLRAPRENHHLALSHPGQLDYGICSLSPTRVLNMKYKIVWTSCLLVVSIPKRLKTLHFGTWSDSDEDLIYNCGFWFRFRSAESGMLSIQKRNLNVDNTRYLKVSKGYNHWW